MSTLDYLKTAGCDLFSAVWLHTRESTRMQNRDRVWGTENVKAILVPHHHDNRKALEKHVYFTPSKHPVDKGFIGDFDGVPVIVNTQLTKHQHILYVRQVDALGEELLRSLC